MAIPAPDPGQLLSIGQLARRSGVPARTIRFWSDAGLVPPTGRSAGGYRLYDAAAVARLDLVLALRELGLGLDAIRAIASRATTVADVAAAHVAVLDGQIRTLRLRRAVLSTVAQRGNTIEEALLMHKLARLSAQERQQIIDGFVDSAFAGTTVTEGAPAASIAHAMRQLPAELPDDPAPEQVDAWIELAELAADQDFRQRVRTMALAGRPAAGPSAIDYQAVIEHAGQARAQGIAPGSPQGQAVLHRIIGPDVTAGQRAALLSQLETFTDARVERYWQLLAIANGQPAPPSVVPVFDWLIATLRTG
jgi:DNA-binding transcriptional MerR regulator